MCTTSARQAVHDRQNPLLFLRDDGIICQLRHCSYISMKVKVSRRLRRRFLPSMEYVGLAKLGFVISPVGIISPCIQGRRNFLFLITNLVAKC